MIVLLHCSTFRAVLNVALGSPKGYQMSLRLPWVNSLSPHVEPGYRHMVSAMLSVTVHAKRVMPVSTCPQTVSLPLVTNHRHIYREAKGGEGPRASESSSHSSRALLPVLLGRARFFGRAACDLVTRQAAGPLDMDSDGTQSLVPDGALLLEDALVMEEALVVELLLITTATTTTPLVWPREKSTTASKRGTESKVAHKWARWLHDPCRRGGGGGTASKRGTLTKKNTSLSDRPG